MSDFPFAVLHSGEEEGRDDREDQSDFNNRFPEIPGLLVDQIRSHIAKNALHVVDQFPSVR